MVDLFKRHMTKLSVLVVALGAVLFVGCAGGDKATLTVASKSDTEGALLGYVIQLVLENDGFTVTDRIQLGDTNAVREAITDAEIDIYPEYTGNGAFFYAGAVSDSVWRDASDAYREIKRLDDENIDVVWLTPAPANNTWGIAVRSDLAEAEGLETLSGLSAYLADGGDIRLAVSPEFLTRADGLSAFESAYGFELSDNQRLIVGTGDTADTGRAASAQTDGANAALAYGTDGGIMSFGLVLLEDDKMTQPVYQPTAIIRREALEQNPEIETLLEPVFRSLSLATLQTLNAKIVVDSMDARDVAEAYLRQEGFIE